MNTGSRYDIATDNWATASAVGAPRGRIDHTAVWTGMEMIVLGGAYAESYPLGTGGLYYP